MPSRAATWIAWDRKYPPIMLASRCCAVDWYTPEAPVIGGAAPSSGTPKGGARSTGRLPPCGTPLPRSPSSLSVDAARGGPTARIGGPAAAVAVADLLAVRVEVRGRRDALLELLEAEALLRRRRRCAGLAVILRFHGRTPCNRG